MRLSTRGKYALEAMVYLGHKSKDDSTISLNVISENAQISEGYLEQLFRLLKKDNIVVSKKGKYGGYSLARPAKDISVGEIILSVEGHISLVRCSESDSCTRKKDCYTHKLWEKAYEMIKITINEISLGDVINEYEIKLEKADVS